MDENQHTHTYLLTHTHMYMFIYIYIFPPLIYEMVQWFQCIFATEFRIIAPILSTEPSQRIHRHKPIQKGVRLTPAPPRPDCK